ncbi:TonB-dependent siderophore receptor [Sphingosinicellaceae bacterium]|nr:TonB-dependent siderophore receptor [Sphingosinicellaceae bacterium]
MKSLACRLLVSTALLAPAARAVAADAADAAANSDIVVTAAIDEVTSATGLALTLKETPQSVTIVDRERIRDFALTNINDLLDHVPGINVERVETDRTEYNSRGFDITNFQVDGIGLPLISALQFGDLDTVLWERVEIVRGANGMMAGVGNPSATINYIRKRPTATLQASVTAQLGSFDDKRVEADVSGPLNASGTVQARAIFAHEDRNSYLDFNKVNRNVYGVLLSWDVAPRLKATVGYSRQQNDSDGVLWGALPLSYSDGSQIKDYPGSASTSAPWTYWNIRDQTAFAELAYNFDNGWAVKGIYTRRRFEEHAKLLYAFGYPDRDTGLGIVGMSGIYPSDYKQNLADLYASGPLHLFGREHQLAFGASYGRSVGKDYEAFSETTIDYPDYRTLGGHTLIPEPDYPDATLQSNTTDKLLRGYAAAHLNFSDRLKGVVGASVAQLKSSGSSYGTDQARNNSQVSPYVGALYDLTKNVTLYASYTGIFNPQVEVDVTNRKLAPAKGNSYEAGIKSEWFDNRLYATASLFHVKQRGLATYAGTFEDGDQGQIGSSYYTGVDTTSKGFEIEIAGKITDRWSLSGGYTGFKLSGGETTGSPRPYLPNRTLKLSSTYAVPELRDLKLGAELRWQDAIHYVDGGVQDSDGNDAVVRQKSYAVLDLMAGIRVVEHVRATLNIRNVTGEKYLGSLLWGQAFYAAPRNLTFALTVAY